MHRLARLANAGHLRVEDPVRAADQFIVLVHEESARDEHAGYAGPRPDGRGEGRHRRRRPGPRTGHAAISPPRHRHATGFGNAYGAGRYVRPLPVAARTARRGSPRSPPACYGR
ncbi:TetR/AcrR family transcriptional regulator C-terminal domain-containing protein [Streptomyces sp. NPDC058231]|uniref:TetR/AcrR family transcriptional regulator C-terminal domain-containing protein n=1 Tax=Streptomyces sp. NPDC058231 TaxID=3346392 RepID=UPI0036E1E7EE